MVAVSEATVVGVAVEGMGVGNSCDKRTFRRVDAGACVSSTGVGSNAADGIMLVVAVGVPEVAPCVGTAVTK